LRHKAAGEPCPTPRDCDIRGHFSSITISRTQPEHAVPQRSRARCPLPAHSPNNSALRAAAAEEAAHPIFQMLSSD
jgi:hypothetical protein